MGFCWCVLVCVLVRIHEQPLIFQVDSPHFHPTLFLFFNQPCLETLWICNCLCFPAPPPFSEGYRVARIHMVPYLSVCCSVSQCSVLQCVAVCCSVLQCVSLCCSVFRCVAVHRSVLQCVAVCCSVLHYVVMCCSVLQCVAVCCNVLQCVSVCCSVVQCSALLQWCRVRQCVAMCCSSL